MLDKIVVGYAGDRAGRDAIALAGTLAAAVQGSLTVVFPYHPVFARQTAEEAQARVAAEVNGMLAAEPALRWSSSPWPIHALHEMAEYEHADLIVFGGAREGLGDHLHVSLMERMVHGAPCAVAVAPDGYGSEAEHVAPVLRRIGVGFANSNEGRAAVELARGLAASVDGELCVIAGAGLEPALASYAYSSPALVDIEAEIYQDTEQELERFCAGLAHETVRGDPASVLVERSAGLDLLVLGSRAYGPLRHALLGSVSARAMREARCPVLVVPRGVTHGDERDREQRAGAAHQG